MSEDKEREAFERLWKKNCLARLDKQARKYVDLEYSLRRNDYGEYAEPSVAGQFYYWQARTTQQPAISEAEAVEIVRPKLAVAYSKMPNDYFLNSAEAWRKRAELSARVSYRALLPHLTPSPEGDELGLSIAQEPKYTTDGRSIINRASGEAIPHDEPVFIFRARDKHAREALRHYFSILPTATDENGKHLNAVWRRVEDFNRFNKRNPDRMKEPDTANPPAKHETKGGGE